MLLFTKDDISTVLNIYKAYPVYWHSAAFLYTGHLPQISDPSPSRVFLGVFSISNTGIIFPAEALDTNINVKRTGFLCDATYLVQYSSTAPNYFCSVIVGFCF